MQFLDWPALTWPRRQGLQLFAMTVLILSVCLLRQFA